MSTVTVTDRGARVAAGAFAIRIDGDETMTCDEQLDALAIRWSRSAAESAVDDASGG